MTGAPAIVRSPREAWLAEPLVVMRFWSKVDRRGPEECWPWIGYRRRGGYGHLSIRGRWYTASRVALMLALGRELTEDECALHKCNNPPCCNVGPRHVYLGDQRRNSLDCIESGRAPRGDRHGSHTCPESVARGDRHYSHLNPERVRRGEEIANAKLTSEKVLAIRGAVAAGMSQRMVASHFGVTQSLVSQIHSRRVWRHLS